MLSQIPINLSKTSTGAVDNEILRTGMIAELDAVNLYEQMAAVATNPNIKKVLLDIAGEEKTHMAEFEAVLLSLDKEQKSQMSKGEEEVNKLIKK